MVKISIFTPLMTIVETALGTVRELEGRRAHVRRQEAHPEHQMTDVATGKNPCLELCFSVPMQALGKCLSAFIYLYPTLFCVYVNRNFSESCLCNPRLAIVRPKNSSIC